MRYQQPMPQPPMQQPMPQPPVQQGAPGMPQQEGYPFQPTGAQPVIPPVQDCPVPLDRGYKRVAGLYMRDSWQMLLGVTGLLLIIFVAVRLATRGYLWGLIFPLLAAVALEIPALRYLPASLMDKLSGNMLVRTIFLQGVELQAPSLLARLGLSSRSRYTLVDEQGRRYFFTAAKGLETAFADLQGMEVEIAFLSKSGLMTGIHPVRRTEHMSVFDSARERHLRQVFQEYLP